MIISNLLYFILALTSIVPTNGPITGGTPVSIKGNFFLDTLSLFCSFGNQTSGETTLVPAVLANETAASCLSPAKQNVSEDMFMLFYNGKPFTEEIVPFRFVGTMN